VCLGGSVIDRSKAAEDKDSEPVDQPED